MPKTVESKPEKKVQSKPSKNTKVSSDDEVETQTLKLETEVKTKSKDVKSKSNNAKKIIEKTLEKSEDDEEEVEQQMEADEVEEDDQLAKKSKKKEPLFKTAAEALTHIEEQQEIIYRASSTIRNTMKEYKKLFNREQKQMKSHKKSERDPNKPTKKSGFNKETNVPENIRNFLNNYCNDDFRINDDELKARTWVTKAIYNYIHSKELSDKDNGRIIKADKPLGELFGIDNGSEIHFESFQTLLSNAYKNNKTLSNEAEDSESEEEDDEEEAEAEAEVEE